MAMPTRTRRTRRVLFTFDERSLESLREMVGRWRFDSMADAVRDSLGVNRALLKQADEGFTEIVVRDPKTKQERVMIQPIVRSKAGA